MPRLRAGPARAGALHPNPHGVGVVWVIGFGRQRGVHAYAHPLLGTASAAHQSPAAVLVMGLADHVQVDMALAEQNFRSVTRSSGLLVGGTPPEPDQACAHYH